VSINLQDNIKDPLQTGFLLKALILNISIQELQIDLYNEHEIKEIRKQLEMNKFIQNKIIPH